MEARFEPGVRGSQPLPAYQQIEAKPADSSAIPAGVANASPVRQRTKGRDQVRTTVLAAAAIALLTFLGSMIAVLTIDAPKP